MYRLDDSSSSSGLLAADASLDKTLRKFRAARYPQYTIYLIVCFIFLTALVNAASVLYVRLTLKLSDSRGTVGSDKELGRRSARHISLRRLPYALVNTARIVACRICIPIGPSIRFTLIEVVICILHLLVMLLFEFVNTHNIAGVLDPKYWANRAAVLAVSQTTLVVALSGKNNIISMLSGISYEKLNIFHRAFSRTVLLLIWIHMWGRVKLGLVGDDSLYLGYVRSGIVANASLTLMVILGIRQLRNLAYEVFLAGHIVLSIIFLVSACIHVTNARQFLPYVWSACIFWAFDRSLRLARVIRIRYLVSRHGGCAGQATIVASSADTVGVSLRITRTSRLLRFGWRPGQSAYLSVPEVARWGLGLSTEAHPFTIASIDTPLVGSDGAEPPNDTPADQENQNKETQMEIKFLIRVREGFTKRLHEYAVRAGGMRTVSAYVDGPYGDPPAVYSYPNVVLVGGGSGVSFTLPLLLDLVRRAKMSTPATVCRKVKFVWYIRERAHFECISNDLKAIEACLPTNLQIDIAVFVTGKADNPTGLSVPSLNSSVEKHVEAEMQVSSGEPGATASKERIEVEIPGSESEKTGTGASEVTNSIMHLGYGKPVVSEILKDEVSLCTDSVAVCVSGPQSLIDDVRDALRNPRIAGPMAVLRGGPSVFLHVEHFGM